MKLAVPALVASVGDGGRTTGGVFVPTPNVNGAVVIDGLLVGSLGERVGGLVARTVGELLPTGDTDGAGVGQVETQNAPDASSIFGLEVLSHAEPTNMYPKLVRRSLLRHAHKS